jgi:23S rRNA maturation-related 3'-5' exoribonuclease YhaM
MSLAEFPSLQLYTNVEYNAVVRNLKSHFYGAMKDKEMVFVTLEDLTGTVDFTLFKTLAEVEEIFSIGMMYKVMGTVKDYKGTNSLEYESSSLIRDTEENRRLYDKNSSKYLTEENWGYFTNTLEGEVKDPAYKRMIELALGLGAPPTGVSKEVYEARLDRFTTGFASMNHHDAYAGGLTNHYVGLTRLLTAVKHQYETAKGRTETASKINWDFMYTLLVYHDIEKPSDYIIKGSVAIWNEEKKINHIYEGIIYLSKRYDEAEEDNKISNADFELLKHAILSHHGEFGEVKINTPEERIFNAIDIIEANNVDQLY